MDNNLYGQYLLDYKIMIKLALLNSHKTSLSIAEIAIAMIGNKLDRCIVEEIPPENACKGV